MKYKDSDCKRCGTCCREIIWRRKFSFEEISKILEKPATKKEIEAKVTEYQKNYMESYGLRPKKIFLPEWDKKNKKLIIQIRAGRCKHLLFAADKIAFCLNYKNRPKECRSFLCKKARNSILLKKVRKTFPKAQEYFFNKKHIRR